MIFLVESIDSNHKRGYLFVEQESMAALLKHLSTQRIIPLSIREIPQILSFLVPVASIKIKPEEVIELIESLHLIIKSGLPLHTGLLDLAEDSNNPKFKKMLISVAEDIHQGKSLSGAFKPYEKAFGVMIINLIHIGEETGQLQATLERGAQFLKRTLNLKKKAKSALIYPMISLLTVTAAMLTWMIYVLPQMTQLFKEMNVELPAITLFIIALSDFVTNYIGYIIGGLIVLAIIFVILHKKYQQVRFHTDNSR
jgi:type II secretory pathway component PulF